MRFATASQVVTVRAPYVGLPTESVTVSGLKNTKVFLPILLILVLKNAKMEEKRIKI